MMSYLAKPNEQPHSAAVDHPSRRLIIHLPRPYDEARELYETLVPEVDRARFGQMANWQATLELAEINPHTGSCATTAAT
jgi:hypothetical protein